MATFEEIADGLDRVVSKAGESNAALVRAGRLADEAARLLTEVMRGSGHAEEEFTAAVQAWSDVVDGVAQLSEIIAVGCQRVESYRATLSGADAAPPPVLAGQSAPVTPNVPSSVHLN